MPQPVQPTKQEVRDYMEKRQESRQPPPSRKDILRQLGWELIEQSRKEAARRR
ncbi:MAG: hypothetical protein JWR22_1312 [Herminiimonas sp.]|nr:hypothetical protein [Herminiimonas sp.]